MEKEIEKFPAIRDHNGLSVLPDGAGFIAGKTAVGGKQDLIGSWTTANLKMNSGTLWLVAAPSSKELSIKAGGWVTMTCA